MRVRSKAFTLVELMIVVAIVGILAAIAYPSYTEYVKRGQRSAIVSLLSEQTQALERYYSGTGKGQYTNVADSPLTLSAGNRYYTIGANRTAQAFTLTATPVPTAMMNGDKCGNFVITNTGKISNSTNLPTKDCWGR